MKVFDIKSIAEIAHKNKILLAVDSTFVTPYFQRPLNFGADLVVHSISKYINGHTDVIMGVTITNNEGIYKKLKFLQTGNCLIFLQFRFPHFQYLIILDKLLIFFLD
jgi:cystathionine gamma-lyase